MYRITKECIASNCRKKIQKIDGFKLKIDPKLMKENSDGNTFCCALTVQAITSNIKGSIATVS